MTSQDPLGTLPPQTREQVEQALASLAQVRWFSTPLTTQALYTQQAQEALERFAPFRAEGLSPSLYVRAQSVEAFLSSIASRETLARQLYQVVEEALSKGPIEGQALLKAYEQKLQPDTTGALAIAELHEDMLLQVFTEERWLQMCRESPQPLGLFEHHWRQRLDQVSSTIAYEHMETLVKTHHRYEAFGHCMAEAASERDRLMGAESDALLKHLTSPTDTHKQALKSLAFEVGFNLSCAVEWASVSDLTEHPNPFAPMLEIWRTGGGLLLLATEDLALVLPDTPGLSSAS